MRLSRRKPFSFTRPWQESRPIALLVLIWLSVAGFVVQFTLNSLQPGFVRDYLALSEDGIHNAYSWQFVTAALLYSNAWHLLGNLFALYVLGRDVESILGQRHFLYLFLAGAIGGELAHLFLMPANTVLYGASGGLAAVIIAYATILPELDLTAWHLPRLVIRIKAKHFAAALMFLSGLMLLIDRHGAVMHSVIPGGLVAGWVYANLLGFGHASWLRRLLRQRREAVERIERMSAAEFVTEKIDPLLEKISREGVQSLSKAERRLLAMAQQKMG